MELPAERFRTDLARLCDAGNVRILAAVSGGADSLALLLLLHEALGPRCRAATVDHGLRAGSRAEAEQVAAICRARGIAHAILTGDLPARAGRTGNLSARARVLRYRLLDAHAAATGCDLVATAHHADDQLETLAMRLNRGAGVAGLAGVRARGEGRVRPLLGWRRAKLAALVAAAGLPVADDPSNADDRFDRARLRKALAGADWLDAARWSRSAAALGEAEDALAWTVRRLAAERCIGDAQGVTLSLADEPRELVRRLVLHCLVLVDPAIDPRADAVLRLVDLIGSAERHGLGRHPRATLGKVLVRVRVHPETGLCAHFCPAPPRRRG